MRSWTFLLGGLLVWALHFFLVYGIASVFPGTTQARILTLAATLLCLGGALLLLRPAVWHWREAGRDGLSRWMSGVAAGGAALAVVAIVFQGLPAMLS
jgi:hypothetical protein